MIMVTVVIWVPGNHIPMTTDTVSQATLYRLLTFLSPSFPIGAFTYSHGLEQVIEDGVVTNRDALTDWLSGILRHGAGRSDSILLKETWTEACAGKVASVRDLAELGLALQPSKERHLESSAQGTAFVEAIGKSWSPGREDPAGQVFHLLTDAGSGTGLSEWPYPVALGVVCAAHNIPLNASVMSYLHAFSANIVSAAIRAVPLGQNDGQKVIADLEYVISDVTETVLSSGTDDLGTSTFMADIASMRHETQYTRLFRT